MKKYHNQRVIIEGIIMTILITGGAGFLGFHLAERLLEAEQEVVVFDLDIDKIKDKAPVEKDKKNLEKLSLSM